jgi:hypothetical protein
VGIRDRLRSLERQAEGEYTALLCRECGERFRVAADTDLEYLAWEWIQETRAKSYRDPHPDVFVVADHPHGVGMLVYEATGEPWPEILNRTAGVEGADDGA